MTTIQGYHGGQWAGSGEFIPRNRVDSTSLAWMSPEESYASKYGSVSQMRANVARIFDTRTDAEARRLWAEYAEENGAESAPYAEYGFSQSGLPLWENNDAVWIVAQAAGYDAIVTSEANGEIGIGVRPESII